MEITHSGVAVALNVADTKLCDQRVARRRFTGGSQTFGLNPAPLHYCASSSLYRRHLLLSGILPTPIRRRLGRRPAGPTLTRVYKHLCRRLRPPVVIAWKMKFTKSKNKHWPWLPVNKSIDSHVQQKRQKIFFKHDNFVAFSFTFLTKSLLEESRTPQVRIW